MSDLTDEELDYNLIIKGLCNMQGLEELEKKYQNKPYMIEKIKKAKRQIVVNRLLSGDELDVDR